MLTDRFDRRRGSGDSRHQETFEPFEIFREVIEILKLQAYLIHRTAAPKNNYRGGGANIAIFGVAQHSRPKTQNIYKFLPKMTYMNDSYLENHLGMLWTRNSYGAGCSDMNTSLLWISTRLGTWRGVRRNRPQPGRNPVSVHRSGALVGAW
jgi:hypothetical protein